MWELFKGNWPILVFLLAPVAVEVAHIPWLYRERKRLKKIQQETGSDGFPNWIQKLARLN